MFGIFAACKVSNVEPAAPRSLPRLSQQRSPPACSKAEWARPHDDAPVDLWPDISKLPTPQAVAVLAAARRSRPEDYFAVVNGLRWRRRAT